MKSKIFTFFILSLAVPSLILAQPTEEQILARIESGLDWLIPHQTTSGYWNDEVQHEPIAVTGLVLTKLCDYAFEHGLTPFNPEYEYYDNVVAGFDFIFSNVKDNGIDRGWCATPYLGYHHEIYNAAIALMAVAVSESPDRVITVGPASGMTFMQLQEEMIEYFEWAQEDNPPWVGGWRYTPNGGSDNSHTGWVTLALRYAEVNGSVIPPVIKSKLSTYIDYIQCTDGSSGYVSPCDWSNTLKAGNLLLEMAFVGDLITDARVQNAISYIQNTWNTSADPGYGETQAMYCLLKGFESFGIEEITVGGSPRNWFDDFSTLLFSWSGSGLWYNSLWTGPTTSTCWALMVLEKVAPPPPVIMVDLDIHPNSWPNPLMQGSKGVTPVAVLGTEDFDVSQLDPPTLMLEGVAPLRWAMEDVGTPVENEGGCNDTELEGDGIMDLTLKYETQELMAALGALNIGDELVLELTGLTLDEKNIFGDDCVIIVGNSKKSASVSIVEYSLLQNYPNPFDEQTQIIYELPEESHVLLSVFNMMGQEVKTIVDQTQPSGQYVVEFNAANLPEGQYFYRITTHSFNETKIMNVMH